MPHHHHDDARKSHGDRLERMVGKRGEYPPDKAARIAAPGGGPSGQGDAAKTLDAGETAGAPARQISITGSKVKGA